MSTQSKIQVTEISLSDITPSPLNPRKHFDEVSIQELAASIIVKGVLVPILVRPVKGGKYEIIAGERRYRASKMTALLETIPCIIRDINEEEALDLMIIENLQRKDIHPMEEANGFKQIMDIKHFDIKEIAARVGKDARYVAQRLQLTHLIDEIQQHFFNGLLLVKDALTISTFSPDDQRDLYTDSLDGSDRVFGGFSEWSLNKFRHKLRKASFDITDATIAPLAGACTTCPFNSACQPLLFPEMAADPVCQRPECFRNKTDIAFAFEIVRAAEDPSVVLVTGEYQPEKATKELMKKFDGVIADNQYTEIHAPDYPDRADFEDNNDTAAEDEQEFQQAVADFDTEMAEFNAKVSRGGFIKAFKIGGRDKGKYAWIKLNKSTKGVTAKPAQSKSPDLSIGEEEIKSEIQRIKDREKRAKQLDDSKIWDQVKVMFKPIDNIKDFTDNNLTQIELTAAAYAIFNKLDYWTKDKYREFICGAPTKKSKGKTSVITGDTLESYFSAITPFGVNELLRVFFLDTLPPTAIYHEMDGDAAIMMKVAEAYWPLATETICIAQRDIADKRAARVAARIKALQAQLKPAKKEKAPAAPKKGKGIKALIPIIILFLLTSCTLPADTITPSCTIATTSQVADRLHLQIHSTSAYVTLVRQSGRDMHIDSSYFRCVSLSVYPSETITIIDGVEECQIITSPFNSSL